jgi:cysteinyl-tRNA synthetase
VVPQIVRFIDDLVSRGFAYAVEGDVYFRVARDPKYGQLSGQRPDAVEEQEPNPLKEDPRDFALWKANKPDEDTWWESPWGRGRPGWHIECSVMAEEIFGPTFEIHGGGLDLVFPHHENELAQSRALGHEFARLWMHNGMLAAAGEKMAKSVGNLVTLREALDCWGRETVLLYFMTGHWSKPLDFSDEAMAQARAQLGTFRNAFRAFGLSDRYRSEFVPTWEALEEALDENFNTPEALQIVNDWRSAGQMERVQRALEIFGLESLAEDLPEEIVLGPATEVGTATEVDTALPIRVAKVPRTAPQSVRDLATQRDHARLSKNYEEADRLRAAIDAEGWEVRDIEAGFELVPKQ